MRPALITFVFLLLVGFGAWVFLSGDSQVPQSSHEPLTTEQPQPAHADGNTPAEIMPDVGLELSRATQNKQAALSSSALASSQQGFQIVVRRGEDLQAVPGAVVSVYALHRHEESRWRDNIWLGTDSSTSTDHAISERPKHTLITDKSGVVYLPLPTEYYGLSAATDSMFGMNFVTTSALGTTLEILVWPDQSLEIVVRDRDGNLLEGIPVGPLQNSSQSGTHFLGLRTTNKNGSAQFAHLGARIRQLSGVPLLTVAASLPWNVQPAVPVPLDQLPEKIVLISPATGNVVVKLVDAQGRPFLEPCVVSLQTIRSSFAGKLQGPKPPPFMVNQSRTTENGEAVFKHIGLDLDLIATSSFARTSVYVQQVSRPPRTNDNATVLVLQAEPNSVVFPLRILGPDSTPLANTKLYFDFSCRGENKHAESAWSEHTTDADGRLRWGLGKAGLVHNGETLTQRRVTISTGDTPTEPPAEAILNLLQDYEEGVQAPQDIQLSALPQLAHGIVLSPSGLPVANAKVALFLQPEKGSPWGGSFWWSEGTPVRTDEKGVFRLFGTPSTFKAKLDISHPDFILASVEFMQESQEQLVIELENTLLIAGRFIFDHDIPAQAFQVEFLGRNADGIPFSNTTPLQEDGRFSFASRSSRPIEMKLLSGQTGLLEVWQMQGNIPMPAAETSSQPYALIDLRSSINSYELHVLDEQGAAINNVRVGFRNANDRFTGLGYCRFGAIKLFGDGTELEVVLSSPSFLSQTVTLTAGERVITRLSKGQKVRFVITPPPLLPDGVTISLSLKEAGSGQQIDLGETVVQADGTLTTTISATGTFRPSLSVAMQTDSIRMSTGVTKPWRDSQLMLTVDSTTSVVHLPVDQEALTKAAEAMMDQLGVKPQ